MTCLQGPVGCLDKEPTAYLIIETTTKYIIIKQVTKEDIFRMMKVDDDNDDDDDDDDDDRLSVTAGHDSHVTVNDEEDLSLYSNEFEKGGGDYTRRRARYTIIVCQ